MASAQALRDEEDSEGWAVARARKKGQGAARAAGPGSNAGAVVAFSAIGAVMLLVLMLGGTGGGGGGRPAYPAVSFETGKTAGVLDRASGALGDWVRGAAPATLEHSFSNGLLSAASNLSEWASVRVSDTGSIDDPRDWMGKNRVASLRIWKRSTALQNYQMEFRGTIEKTSLSWAIRAADANNFYATKLAIIRSGPVANAGIVRFAMVNGKETDRSLSPLPITLERGKEYSVRVKVQDNQFLTYLDGKFVGEQTDKKLSRGGVGFFDDQGDPQKIAWVSVSERDSFWGRMLSHFALIMFPGDDLPQ